MVTCITAILPVSLWIARTQVFLYTLMEAQIYFLLHFNVSQKDVYPLAILIFSLSMFIDIFCSTHPLPYPLCAWCFVPIEIIHNHRNCPAECTDSGWGCWSLGRIMCAAIVGGRTQRIKVINPSLGDPSTVLYFPRQAAWLPSNQSFCLRSSIWLGIQSPSLPSHLGQDEYFWDPGSCDIRGSLWGQVFA